MIKSDIVFTGYYGQLNTGDDAFVEVASWGGKRFWKKDKTRFLGVKSRLPDGVSSIKGYPFRFPKSYSLQQQLLINNTDYLISAGGSTFQNSIKKGSLKFKALRLSKKNKIQLGAIGVSLGPFKTTGEEKDNIEYLKNLTFLTLRDNRSYEYAKSLELPYEPVNAFDLAALLPDIYDFEKKMKNDNNTIKSIGVSVCNYESYTRGNITNEERRNYNLINLLKKIDANCKVNFCFFEINGNPMRGDLPLTRKVIERVNFKNKVEVFKYSPNTRMVWNRIANCDFMLSTRLHGAIFACFAEVPFMLIEYHKKCTDFLNDVGQSFEYRLNDAEFDENLIFEKIENFILNNSWNKPKYLENMKQKSLLNFNMINI